MRTHGGRLALVAWPLDAFFRAARYAGMPVLLLVVGIPLLPTLVEPLGFEPSSPVAVLAVVAVCLVYLAIVRVPSLSDALNKAFSRARRKIRLACGDASMAVAHEPKLICRLLPNDLRAPLFQYDRQRDVVSTLTDSAIDGDNGEFWVVEGPSGSGKTRAAYLLADALIRHPSEFGLAEKVRYFDLAAGSDSDLRAVRALTSSQLDGTITFLDNFHRVGRRAISSLTHTLLDTVAGAQTRLLILLARPTETWKLSPGTDVRLVSEAKDRKRHLALDGAPSEPLRRALAAIDEDLAAHISEVGCDAVATAAQLHLCRLAAANSRTPSRATKVGRVLEILGSDAENSQDVILKALLGTICALGMHRGFFTRRQFIRAARLVVSDMARRRRLMARYRLHTSLRDMKRVCFAPWVRTGSGRYVFHEAVAESVIERLIGDASFADAFRTVGMDRLKHDVATDADVGWMIAAEIGADAELSARFDAAMLSGAFYLMAQTLARVEARRELSESVRMQLGLLHDRTGEFERAREVIGRGLLTEAHNRRSAEHLAARIEASHDKEALADAATLVKSSDPLIAAAGRYWELHMAAHRGQFAADELGQLCTEMQPSVGKEDRWAIFTLARAHFDHLRHLYLSGRATPQAISAARDSSASRMLQTTLPIFDAMNTLYVRAHLCAHVVLPRLALERGEVTPLETELLEVDALSLDSAERVAALALSLYRRARDEFWQYGDREARYLDGDVVNAQLMTASHGELKRAPRSLHGYADYISKTGFADIASLPHLYFVRYHSLCYFEAAGADSGVDGRSADEHYDEARRHVRIARRLDEAVGNAYGVLRSEVFDLFLVAAKHPVSAASVQGLSYRAEQSGYIGLKRALAPVASSKRMTSTEVGTLIRFTPVVHQ